MSCRKYINFTYNRDFRYYFPNFTASEFRCGCKGKHCSGYPAKLDFDLVDGIQKIRDHFGKPVQVTSGLRCSKYNSSLPGSIKNSKHKTGAAADIYINGVDASEIVKYWQKLGLGYSYCGTSNMGKAAHVQIGW